MLKLREANQHELSLHSGPGYETWGAVLLEDDKEVGHIFLSKALGCCYGHDAVCQAKDPNGAVTMFFRARKQARDWGFTELYVHASEQTESFWKNLGFEPVCIVLKGPI